ncbi:hypothetical protein [Thauera sp.]
MSLLSRLREKQSGKFATATPATFATQREEGGRTVASVATVAVASPEEHKPAPLTAEEEQAIRAWLIHIDEDDPAIIAEVLGKCRDNPEARAYFLGRSEEVPPPDPDDRRTCHACRHLRGGQCASRRHGIEGEASHRFHPHPDLPRRCAGFVEVSR